MEPLSQTRRMRQEFRVAIRRQKKQEIFENYRMKLRNNLVEQQQNKMMKFLDSPERREEWILRMSRELTGIPDESWRYLIKELHWSLLCFKGKGCFQIWIETEIIKNLCSVFYEEYINLDLCSQAAKILSNYFLKVQGNIIGLQEQEEQQKTSYVAKQIFSQEILRNVILLSEDTTKPHNQISQYMTLIANLAVFETRLVIRDGGFTVYVQWALRMLKQRKLNRSYLQQIYSFLYFVSKNLKMISNNYNIALKTFDLVNQFIQIDQTETFLAMLLQIVFNILQLQKQALYSSFINFRPLTKKVFQLANHDNQNLRELSWNILGYVTSGKLSLIGVFQENHFIDAMIIAYEKQPKDNSNFDKITQGMLTCLNNLIFQGDKVLQQILCSSLINIIIDSTHPDRSTNLRKDAYYCLSSAVTSTQNYNLFNKIVKQLPILQKLIIGLQTMMIVNKGTIAEILSALLHLIRIDHGVFRSEDQRLTAILEAKYSFTTLLKKVEDVYGNNAYIMNLVNTIYDLHSC